jgi:DNA polymerase elongation subunit (family B)
VLHLQDDQYKARSLLKKEGRVKVRAKKFAKLKKKFIPGATVLRPKQGYKKRPTTTYDFTSLYPMIMISRNMSHETELIWQEIVDHQLEIEKDYYRVEAKTYDQLFKLPLCKACTLDPSHIMTCPKETPLDEDGVRKKNWEEKVDYYRHVERVEEVFFLKQICQTCMTCPKCELLRDYTPGAFCPAHETCATCPKIRHRAVLIGVIQKLLDLRAINKDFMKVAKKIRDKAFTTYLAMVGFPSDTNPNRVPVHTRPPEAEKCWAEYLFYKGEVDIFDGRQAGNKVTCKDSSSLLQLVSSLYSIDSPRCCVFCLFLLKCC